MRGELEIPSQFSRVGVDRQNTRSVEIVARSGISDEIRRRIAGSPIQSVELRIVGAWHPGCAAAVEVRVSRPTVGAEFSRPWNGPQAPLQLSGDRIEGGHESAHPGV